MTIVIVLILKNITFKNNMSAHIILRVYKVVKRIKEELATGFIFK